MKKILFIANPLSGGKDKELMLKDIDAAIDRQRFEPSFVFTEYPGHATSLAGDADAPIVVAVGGDGTVSEVAKGLAGTEKVMGIIPCGSGDGLALHLGISRNPLKALRTIQDGVSETMDYGKLDGNPFFCTAGFGLDAEVAWEFASSGKRGPLFQVLFGGWENSFSFFGRRGGHPPPPGFCFFCVLPAHPAKKGGGAPGD